MYKITEIQRIEVYFLSKKFQSIKLPIIANKGDERVSRLTYIWILFQVPKRTPLSVRPVKDENCW